jgi:hypothetical protein
MNRPGHKHFLLLFAMMLILGPSLVAEANVGRDYGESVRALNQEKFKKAEQKIRDALGKNSQAQASIEISGGYRYPYLPYYVLGAALHGQGNCPGALEAWQESLKQGHVQNSEKEFDALQAGMSQCGASLADSTSPPSEPAEETKPQEPAPEPAVDREYTRLAAAVTSSLNQLRATNSRYAQLADNPDLAPDWSRDWKPSLDIAQREHSKLTREFQQAESRQDVAAVRDIAGELKTAIDDITARKLAAEQRIKTLEDQRTAQARAREEERKRQEAIEEQRRLAAVRERQEAERRKSELEQRERVAAAQRGLRQELDRITQYLDETTGNDRVIEARNRLAEIAVTSESQLTSTSLENLNKQSQAVRDGQRRYNQAVQEWEAEKREIALRTPPPELRKIADEYFAGRYASVSQLADPGQFSDTRNIIQTYLFRSAAQFNQYWLTGGNREELLRNARDDIIQIKRLNGNFMPYVAAFSPKFLEFFQNTGGS